MNSNAKIAQLKEKLEKLINIKIVDISFFDEKVNIQLDKKEDQTKLIKFLKVIYKNKQIETNEELSYFFITIG